MELLFLQYLRILVVFRGNWPNEMNFEKIFRNWETTRLSRSANEKQQIIFDPSLQFGDETLKSPYYASTESRPFSCLSFKT